jgi:hypothetical protein
MFDIDLTVLLGYFLLKEALRRPKFIVLQKSIAKGLGD